jgi:two-component system LytT family response regulator
VPLTTLVIDDEASARSRLRKLLAAHLDVEVVGEAVDGLQALDRIQQLRPDLIFLDVQMPGMSGFEVLDSLPKEAPSPLVIFTTAFDEYALAAFEVNATGYLLKPVSRERLGETLERARKLTLSESLAGQERERARRAATAAAPAFHQLVGRRRDRFVLVALDQVVLICVEDGLVKVKTQNETVWTDYQLSDLEARLPDPPFFRARRSVIVNMQRVKEIAPYFKSTYLLILNDS